jgi:hypothetical protein
MDVAVTGGGELLRDGCFLEGDPSADDDVEAAEQNVVA